MLGFAKYRGADRITPANYCFPILTALIIIIPSIPALTFVPFHMCGWLGGAIICILEVLSLANTIRVLYLCATVEPGIIPKIRSKSVNYTKVYKVSYRDEQDVLNAQKNLRPVEAFFSLWRFQIEPEV